MRMPEAASRVLASKWGSSSGAGPCMTATEAGAAKEEVEDVDIGTCAGGVDEMLVVAPVPDPVVCGGTVAGAEDTTAAVGGGGGGTGEGAL